MKKAIIVSSEAYFTFFAEAFPQWDIQHPVVSIDQMWDDLGNETLDENSEVVVLNDDFYNPDSEQLELAILTLAGEALVLVIADPEYQEAIQSRIEAIAARDYYSIPKFWFVSRVQPYEDIEAAVAEYDYYKANNLSLVEQEAAQPAYSEPIAIHNEGFTDHSNTQYQDYGNEPSAYGTEQYGDTSHAYEQNPYLQTEESGYVPEPRPEAQEVEDYYDTTRQEFYGDGYTGEERQGMIIASTSSKGGSGKSTVGLCTASMLFHSSRLAYEKGKSERPLDVVIVDMDTRDGQVGFLLGESTPTVLNIFTSQDFSRNNIRQNLIYNARLGIYALLAPKRARTADYTTPDFYRDLIQKLRTMFDIVILDTSVHYTDPLIYDVILPISDAVLFVTDMSKGAVFGMTRWIAEVTLPIEEGGSAAITKDKIGVVVNKSMGNVGFDQANLVEAASEVPLLVSIPMDSAAVLAATNSNRLDDIVLEHPNISPAYFSLAQQIIQGQVPIIAPDPVDPEDPSARKGPSKAPPLAKKKKGLFGRG